MAKIVTFGEMLLRLNAPGRERLFQSSHLATNFVGAEANVAMSLARLGHEVTHVTALPDNPLGAACQETLARHGVRTDHIITAPGRLGTYYFEFGAMMRPSAITYDRAGSVFADTPAVGYDWDAVLADADMLHLSGINLALGDGPSQACVHAVTRAQAKGITVSFDCNYRPSLWVGREDAAIAAMKTMAQRANILFAGARDAGLLYDMAQTSGGTPEASFSAAADTFFTALPQLTHVAATHRDVISADTHTLSGFLANRDGSWMAPPCRLEGIVDRIGGGDAFAAGMLHALCCRKPAEACAQFALAAAALKHSIPGDVNLVNEADINAAMTGTGGDVKR